MKTFGRLLFATLATLAAFACVQALAMPFAHAEPAIDLDRTTVKPGQTVTVRLTGWTAGNLLVELCGNQARRGTADCAVASSASTFVGKGKTAAVMLNVAKPPVGCPCVIAVRPVTGGTPRTVPITVSGMPTLSATQRPTTAAGGTRHLTATKVTVRGGGFMDGWLSGGTSRTLRVTLRNEGTTALTDPPLSLTIGRGPEPTDLVTAPALGTLEPGAERTYDIPVTLDAPAFGRYTIRGEISGLDEPIGFTAHTATYPWAFPLLGALLVPLPLLTVRRRKAPVPQVLRNDGRPRTMNETVAANITWWTTARGLTPDAVAASLTSSTGRPYTAADLPPAAPECPFDATALEALSKILGVPLTALLLPAPQAPGTPDGPAASDLP